MLLLVGLGGVEQEGDEDAKSIHPSPRCESVHCLHFDRGVCIQEK